MLESQQRFDLRTVTGHPPHPDVLDRADAENADLLIAMLPDDEDNLVACQVAHTLFKIPTKIAKLEAATYTKTGDLFSEAAFPIDSIISPQQLVAENIALLIKNPGAVQVSEFASGRLIFVAVFVLPNAQLAGASINELKNTGINCRIAAIYRGDSILIPTETTTIEAEDEIYCVVAPQDVHSLLEAFTHPHKKHKNIFIAGGGNCGMHLAHLLSNDYRIKLMERDPSRAKFLASTLDNKIIVLRVDATAENVLHQEGIENSDLFCAVTSDDEDNIMSAMLAKKHGVKRVMSLVSRQSYVELIEKMVDVAISPQEYSIGPLLCQVRESDIVSVCPLRHGQAEMVEVVTHGAANTSQVVGKRLDEIHWPDTMTVVAIVRNDTAMMAHSTLVIEEHDHIVLFIQGRHRIKEIEKLFRVHATFV